MLETAQPIGSGYQPTAISSQPSAASVRRPKTRPQSIGPDDTTRDLGYDPTNDARSNPDNDSVCISIRDSGRMLPGCSRGCVPRNSRRSPRHCPSDIRGHESRGRRRNDLFDDLPRDFVHYLTGHPLGDP